MGTEVIYNLEKADMMS
jgi:hypothetical protein